jgi:hypothetical protein
MQSTLGEPRLKVKSETKVFKRSPVCQAACSSFGDQIKMVKVMTTMLNKVVLNNGQTILCCSRLRREPLVRVFKQSLNLEVICIYSEG